MKPPVFLPRVTVCDNGSYCCDRFPNRCEAKQGVFLNANRQVVDNPPTTVSTTSVVISTSSLILANPSTSTIVATPTVASLQATISGGLCGSASVSTAFGIGAKIGLAAGILFGVTIVAGLAAIIIIQQRRPWRVKASEKREADIPPPLYGFLPPQELMDKSMRSPPLLKVVVLRQEAHRAWFPVLLSKEKACGSSISL